MGKFQSLLVGDGRALRSPWRTSRFADMAGRRTVERSAADVICPDAVGVDDAAAEPIRAVAYVPPRVRPAVGRRAAPHCGTRPSAQMPDFLRRPRSRSSSRGTIRGRRYWPRRHGCRRRRRPVRAAACVSAAPPPSSRDTSVPSWWQSTMPLGATSDIRRRSRNRLTNSWTRSVGRENGQDGVARASEVAGKKLCRSRQGELGDLPKGLSWFALARGAIDAARFPFDLADGAYDHRPETPGVWTEEDEFRKNDLRRRLSSARSILPALVPQDRSRRCSERRRRGRPSAFSSVHSAPRGSPRARSAPAVNPAKALTDLEAQAILKARQQAGNPKRCRRILPQRLVPWRGRRGEKVASRRRGETGPHRQGQRVRARIRLAASRRRHLQQIRHSADHDWPRSGASFRPRCSNKSRHMSYLDRGRSDDTSRVEVCQQCHSGGNPACYPSGGKVCTGNGSGERGPIP